MKYNNFLMYFPVGGQLDYFQFGAVINKAVVKYSYKYICDLKILCKHQIVTFLGHRADLWKIFEEITRFLKWLQLFNFDPPRMSILVVSPFNICRWWSF